MKLMTDMTSRELDALVALKVFGQKRTHVSPEGKVTTDYDCPHYSTDINDAWTVWQHLAALVDGTRTIWDEAGGFSMNQERWDRFVQHLGPLLELNPLRISQAALRVVEES